MNLNQSEEITPFYKEPMVLLLIVPPIAAVIWGMVMLSLAFNGKDSLVSDSYYKEGVSYTESEALIKNARALGVSSEITFSDDGVELFLKGDFDMEPHSLQLQLIHPTLEERDLTVFMQRIGPGQYAGVLEHEIDDRRHIWLASLEQQWRIKTTDTVYSGKDVVIQTP